MSETQYKLIPHYKTYDLNKIQTRQTMKSCTTGYNLIFILFSLSSLNTKDSCSRFYSSRVLCLHSFSTRLILITKTSFLDVYSWFFSISLNVFKYNSFITFLGNVNNSFSVCYSTSLCIAYGFQQQFVCIHLKLLPNDGF